MGWGEPHQPRGADAMLAADQIGVVHLAAEHRAACDEIHRLRDEVLALQGAVVTLAGWVRDLDPNPSLDPCDYLTDQAQMAAVRAAYPTPTPDPTSVTRKDQPTQ